MASRKTNLKVWIFRDERERQHVFWPLSGQWLPKQLTEKLSWTIIRVVKREKTAIIDYHEEFEQAQTEW